MPMINKYVIGFPRGFQGSKPRHRDEAPQFGMNVQNPAQTSNLKFPDCLFSSVSFSRLKPHGLRPLKNLLPFILPMFFS